jgi:hypothetical protein
MLARLSQAARELEVREEAARSAPEDGG